MSSTRTPQQLDAYRRTMHRRAAEFDRYRGFRHVVRHVHAYALEEIAQG